MHDRFARRLVRSTRGSWTAAKWCSRTSLLSASISSLSRFPLLYHHLLDAITMWVMRKLVTMFTFFAIIFLKVKILQ